LDFGKVVGVLVTFFEREGFRFAAVGAFGLHAYGLSRATLDLDFATEEQAQPKLIALRTSPCPRQGVTISIRIPTSGGWISCT
jgi:hypothetical protein